MHSDHCAKKLLPWFDGMLDADEAGKGLEAFCGFEISLKASKSALDVLFEAFFKEHGEPLFSSHMLDLSEA